MAPESPPAGTALNPIEVRLTGGIYALNRFLMTMQGKRMPVAGLTVGLDAEGAMRATVLLDCPPETARRYTALLSGLEDAQVVGAAEETVEIAVLKTGGDRWREAASRAGVAAHEDGGVVVASGEHEKVESWLASVKGEIEDVVRLGPVARPGNGGG